MSKTINTTYSQLYPHPVGICFRNKRPNGHFELYWVKIFKTRPGLFYHHLEVVRIGRERLVLPSGSTYITIAGYMLPTMYKVDSGDVVSPGRLSLYRHIFKDGLYKDFCVWIDAPVS